MLSKRQLRETQLLHITEDVVQLRSGADVAQKHVINLWSEVFLGDGVILQKTRATLSDKLSMQYKCNGKQLV